MNTQSYTIQILESMANGMIAEKITRGYTKLPNGLFEDVVGNVFTLDLSQTKIVHDEYEVYDIKFTMKKVDIIGRI